MNKCRPLVLMVDDNADLLSALSIRLRSDFEIHTATTVAQGKALSARNSYEAAVVDLCFEGQELDGVHLLDHLNYETPGTFLIILSGDPSIRRAVAAMRRTHFEFIHKDGEFFDSLRATLIRATQIKRSREEQNAHRFLTHSPETLQVIKMADRILRSGTEAAILLQGESGSGKEVLARYLANSLGKDLVSANMANIASSTAESTLFGHVRGAFTDAKENRIGLIESANDKIFFLDEIGECTPEVQAKLLRVVQEKEVLPIGATKPRSVRVQFIAATHQNLDELQATGKFRLDLLQRLNTFVLRIPPLRERPQDVLLYANLFFDEAALKGNTRISLTPSASKVLLAHSWPGNVRELKNIVDRLVALSNKTQLEEEDIWAALRMGKEPRGTPSSNLIDTAEDNVRRNLLISTLEKHRGRRKPTAKELGKSLATIQRWINEFGLSELSFEPRGSA